MVSRVIRKPFYSLDEVCQRWGISPDDLAAFVLASELTLSIPAADLWVDVGEFVEVEGGRLVRSPHGTISVRGPVDLSASDAWRVLRNGFTKVQHFEAGERRFMEVHRGNDPLAVHEVLKAELVVREAEVKRFEAAQLSEGGMERTAADRPAGPPVTGSPRGPVPKYEWDAFWCEVAAMMLFEGPPASLAALVRRMEAWFAGRPKQPDTSTIKKKLSPLWRRVAPEVERISA